MTFEQAEKWKFNPFDLTKVSWTANKLESVDDMISDVQVWSQKEFPLIPVGKFTLDRNPKNYFAEVEQIAFCPAHMPPGIEASPDKMLQVCMCLCVCMLAFKKSLLFPSGSSVLIFRHSSSSSWHQLPSDSC